MGRCGRSAAAARLGAALARPGLAGMNPGPPARRRQLALLTAAVLAAHVALLQPPVRTLAPPRPAPELARFVTRSIAAPAPAPPPVPAAAPAPESPPSLPAP